MSTNLRKGFSHIHVAYTDGGYTNSLSGANFVVHKSSSKLNFEIDLSGNYRVKNKDTNSYLDIHELSKCHENLAYIQVDEDQVLKGLASAKKRNPEASWCLTLHLGELGSHSYEVQPEAYPMGYKFNVKNV